MRAFLACAYRVARLGYLPQLAETLIYFFFKGLSILSSEIRVAWMMKLSLQLFSSPTKARLHRS